MMESAEETEVLAVWGWESFFVEVVRFIQVSQRHFENANQQYTDYVLERLAIIYQSISAIKERLESDTNSVGQQPSLNSVLGSLDDLLTLIPLIANKWQEHSNSLEVRHLLSRYQVPVQQSSHRGRPCLHVTQEQLEYLRSLSFSWSDISRILGISRMTIFRRRVQYGMIFEPSQSVSDSELMDIVHQLRQEVPDLGQSILAGRVRAMGLRVTRDRLRNAIRRSDPLNTALRWHSLTSRRPYSVPGVKETMEKINPACFLTSVVCHYSEALTGSEGGLMEDDEARLSQIEEDSDSADECDDL